MKKLDFSQPQQFISTATSDLAYWKTGSGPDVVFIHGWPLHAATFRNVVAHLQDQFTCHLFNLPGSLHTKVTPATRYDFNSNAQAVCSALKSLGIRNYGLIGHDSGGALARALADVDSEAVTALVLAGTEIPHDYTLILRSLLDLGKHPKRFHFAMKLLRFKTMRHSLFGFGGCFMNSDKIEGDFSDLFIKPLLADSSALEGQRNVLAAAKLSDMNKLQEIHQRITAPVLLLWGANDPFFPVEKAKTMLHDFAQAEMEIFADGKLFIHEEFPQRFAECARAFLLKNTPQQNTPQGVHSLTSHSS